MRAPVLAVVVASLVSLAPLTASAGREVSVGVSTGWSHDQEAGDGTDAARTWGLWGRVRLTSRLAAQAELVRHETAGACDTCTFGIESDIRTMSGMLVVDLADHGHWMPVLFAGVGLDRDDGSIPTKGHHTEGGFGVEYRGDGGFLFGVDARMGGRSIDSQPGELEPATDVQAGQAGGGATFLAAPGLRSGEYRALRLTLGVRF
ncbi:MAG TPA: outer membrane beta-barrel protein [Kofleriaceae bacterium]|nr:outer membrane beta-barrel protein [Kofleriaceae bacterium]